MGKRFFSCSISYYVCVLYLRVINNSNNNDYYNYYNRKTEKSTQEIKIKHACYTKNIVTLKA